MTDPTTWGPHRVLNHNILLYINIHTSIPMCDIHVPQIQNIHYSSFKYWLECWSANIFADTFSPYGTRARSFFTNNLQQSACQHEQRKSFQNHQFRKECTISIVRLNMEIYISKKLRRVLLVEVIISR
jgi:hypothetical protein